MIISFLLPLVENFNDLIHELFNAGPSFINLPHWEQDHTSDNESIEESSGPCKESSICEENFWFSSLAISGQVSGPQFWRSGISRVCACTDSSTRGLSDPNWVHGYYLMLLECLMVGSIHLAPCESFCASRTGANYTTSWCIIIYNLSLINLKYLHPLVW